MILTKPQQRMLKVLERIKEQVEANEDDAEVYCDAFEIMLDDLMGEDFFGSESSTDPRGDQRERRGWSMMDRIQGVDA